MRTGPTRQLAGVAAVVCSLAFTGCLFDGGESDEDRIKSLVKDTIGTDDPDVCTERFTDNLIDQLYDGSVEKCRTDVEDDTEEDPTGAGVENLEIDGDEATGTLLVAGGEQDGAVIDAEFAKEDGDWKFDSLTPEGGSAAAGTDTTATETTPGPAVGSNPALEAALRRQLEKQGLSKPVIDCSIRELRDELAGLTPDQVAGGELPKSLQQEFFNVGAKCQAEAG